MIWDFVLFGILILGIDFKALGRLDNYTTIQLLLQLSFSLLRISGYGVRETFQVKVPVAKLDSLSSIPGTHVMEGDGRRELTLTGYFLTSTHVFWHVHV